MKSENYRIGNCMKDREGRICRVRGIDNREAIAYAIDSPLTGKPVTPIEIDKEWLRMLGFTEEQGVFKIQVRERIFLRGFLTDIGFGCSIDDGVCCTTYLNSCKYVHQLQNLFFALTNTELKVSL